ncbi:hypothetical protein U8P76_05845 [Rhizobium johnstonii]|nr:hypothetical protein U8P76_05845 [Rhizobium johnstonii]
MVMAGNTRINTQIDMTGGTQLFPKFRPERRHGSVFYAGQEQLLGLYQTFESQAADKLVEVITNSSTTRWKDFRDLSLPHGMKLDAAQIGAEVVHKMRRQADSDYAIRLQQVAARPTILRHQGTISSALPLHRRPFR